MNVEIANRLYEYRKQNNLSQDELAEKIGVSRQAVSKWERAEASPDTDNLILLAKLYGVSLDELINSDPVKTGSKKQGDNEETKDYVNISPKGIHVVESDGSEVHVGWKGVHVKDVDEDKEVHIGWDGIKVREGDDYIYDEDGWNFRHQRSFWHEFPVALLVIVAYLILGGYYGHWHPGWIIFFIIPIYHSFIECFYKKTWRGRLNALPVMLVLTAIFLFYGFYYGAWHPYWILLLIGPVYHSLINALFPKRAKQKPEKSKTEDLPNE